MSDALQPNPGSLWARIMGLTDDPPPAPAEPTAPPDNPPVDFVPDDELVAFCTPSESELESPTLKLTNLLPPVPEFARNPLDEVEDRIVTPPPAPVEAPPTPAAIAV